MDLKDVFSICLALSVAYLYNIILSQQKDVVFLQYKVESTEWNTKNLNEDLKKSFGSILGEIQGLYILTERINERVERLENMANRRHNSGILGFIRDGLSRIVQIAHNFFLGQSLRSKIDRSGLFIDIQKYVTETIGKVFVELKDVSESLNESVERLEDAENRRRN